MPSLQPPALPRSSLSGKLVQKQLQPQLLVTAVNYSGKATAFH